MNAPEQSEIPLASESEVLQLQAPAAVSVHPKLESVKKETYKHYESIYGKKTRTLKWWVEQGRSAAGGPDLPPLDRPEEMPAWWERVMTQSCPRSVLEASRAAAASRAAPVEVSVVSQAPIANAASGSSATPAFEAPALTSQDENLNHLKGQLARVRLELLEAETAEPRDHVLIESKERKWRELRTEVEEAEAAIFKLRKLQGKLVDLEAVEAALMPLLSNVVDAVRSTYTRVRPSLSAASTDAEREAIWNRGIDEAFEELVRGGFLNRETIRLSA